MNLIVSLKNGKTVQVDGIDDFGFNQGMLLCLKESQFVKGVKNVAGWNMDDVLSYRLDGEVTISEIIYDSGASLIYDVEKTPVEA